MLLLCPQELHSCTFAGGKEQSLTITTGHPAHRTELAAVDDGIAAYEKLLAGLLDVPAPDGKTPRRLAEPRLHTITPVAK